MNPIETKEFLCPWCGGQISLAIDTTYNDQEYIEECQRCCSPIQVRVLVPEMEEPQVELSRDNE
ncbi:MAG TPA: CPXCG motif-containing cysteine-rich protein [Marinobacterium sp.]|nr:CPXCG motif-containing cysteine-rich protein [Marinobacterium sp.]